MVKIVCRSLVPSLRNMDANIGDLVKKGSFLGGESENMLIRGVVSAACVVKNHSQITSVAFSCVFLKIYFHSAITFMRV